MKQNIIKSTNFICLALSVFFLVPLNTQAKENESDLSEPADRVELTTSFIKGNKELPQVLYIVPWQEVKKITKKPENMVLHSLYGDIFQPITSTKLTRK
jgi:hypothetical protein